MKFVEKHLTKQSLFHKPHKWFLAFLSSPIHFAEIHYKKKYHLNFKHAKKLFVFDMALLVSIIFLICAGSFWFYYNPDVVDQIDLSITPSSDRIISGDYITYTIKYKNNSDKELNEVSLLINLPAGLVIDKIKPNDIYQEKNHSFDLQKLLKNETGEIDISGWYYDTPNQETHITTELLYTQENTRGASLFGDRKTEEVKMINLIQIHRGSILQGTLDISDSSLTQGEIPLKISLKNTGEQKLEKLILPLNLPTGLYILNPTTKNGVIENLEWKIDQLDPNEEVQLNTILQTNLSPNTYNINFELTPKITVNNKLINQENLIHNLTIVHPKLELNTGWQEGIESISPGEKKALEINLKNSGSVELKNLEITLPIPGSIVDIYNLDFHNPGKLINNDFIINSNYFANLKNLAPGESTSLKLDIPIKTFPQGGTDLLLSLSPQLTAEVKFIPEAKYKTSIETPALKVGASLNIKTEIRYYTDEGDQLGRGPLPPKVGKETKYWLWFQLQNSTSKVSGLNFSAKLPDYVQWTGKSSVSHGADINFNENTGTANWSLNSLLPHEKVGIYFELSFTPTENHIGYSPFIIQNISVSALDTYINKKLDYITGPQDISLHYDKIGQDKGVLVTE